MSTSELRLALYGCGGIAQDHLRGLRESAARTRVTAVIDADAQRAAQMADATGALAFASFDEALAGADFDAIDIMLPHDLHEAAAIAAFAAGKHVLLEKPMSTSLESCTRILAAAQASGRVFMIAEQAEYWPDARTIRDMIRDGALGEIITARAFFGSPAGPLTGPLTSAKPWRFYLERMGGGIVIDGGAHWIRPLRMWMGEITELVAVTGRPMAEMEGESLARALLRFESGAVAVLDALYGGAYLGPGEEFRITGTRAEIIIERGPQGRVLLFNEQHPQGHVLMLKNPGRSQAFGLELLDFERAVLDDKTPDASPEYSLGELRTALAVAHSAASGQWVGVGE
jgi:predicted dehydrogenase